MPELRQYPARAVYRPSDNQDVKATTPILTVFLYGFVITSLYSEFII
jgi:hypothetical protein